MPTAAGNLLTRKLRVQYLELESARSITLRHRVTGSLATMKSARVIVCSLLIAAAAAFSVSLVNAQGPGPLADPKSENQAGFPATLYSWVIPPDNQQTPAKIALGKALFFEDALSADGKISCDHCHGPA